MRRTGNLLEQIAERENLRIAVGKALKGKRDRAEARRFMAHLEWHLSELARGLRDGNYPLGAYEQFVIRDPKERVITKPCLAERVVHHAIMNVCEPIFERWLIHDTYACRKGRGRVAALLRAQQFAGRHAFFLKLDIRKYFDSIVHPVLVARLERLFKDPHLLNLLARVIGSFHGEAGVGLPIGSLTSQHFANFYLGWFDRFVKETLQVPGYFRYMDDMLLWGESAGFLLNILDRGQEFLSEQLGLQLKPVPYINRSAHGVDFLGCRVLPDHLLLSRRSRVRFRRNLEQLELAYLAGEIDELTLQQRATSLVAFTQSGGVKSWHFRCAVIEQMPVSGRRPRTG